MIGYDVTGRSTDEDRADGKLVGVLTRFRKRQYAGSMAGHGGKLTGVYANAIEFQRTFLAGVGGFYTTMFFVFGVLFSYIFAETLVPTLLEYGEFEDFLTGVFAFGGSWMFFIFFARLELFAPADQPIYFDRKHRKVYKVVQSGTRQWGIFGPRKSTLMAYDWDLVDAEHQTTMQANTASASRVHHLVFLVRKSADDPTIVDHFIFASIDFVPALWEYIRRYMEDGAAPLVEGEYPPLSQVGAYEPWSDVHAYVPFLDSEYRQRKKERPWKTFFQTIFMPITVPWYLLWLFFNRMTVWTAQKVAWPVEITAAIGPLVNELDLRTDTYRHLRPGRAPEPA